MKILYQSPNLTNKDAYNITTCPNAQKMRSAAGMVLELDGYVYYSDIDRKTGEEKHVIALRTKDGDVYATNSPTFAADFQEACEFAGEELHTIEVIEGTSRNGRPFLMCRWAD